MLNRGKEKGDGNEAGLGMHQTVEQLPLALLRHPLTGRLRQGLRPGAPLPPSLWGHTGLPEPS